MIPRPIGRGRLAGTVDVVVVGAGHSGLAMSRVLARHAIDHVVLERGEVANSWRHERWSSLRLLTPNWQSRLPDYAYDGADPDGFMTMPEVVDFVAGYDTLVRLFDAKYYDDMDADLAELFAHHRLVATNRGDDTLESVERFLDAVPTAYAARIVVMEIPEGSAALSSTLARSTLESGGHGLTGPVRRYIAEHGLYR